jgi:hypothetical protein
MVTRRILIFILVRNARCNVGMILGLWMIFEYCEKSGRDFLDEIGMKYIMDRFLKSIQI